MTGCLVFARMARAAPVRLLVLGNSLAAGYGLARQDAFQTRLAEALRAHGHDVAILDGAVSGDTTRGRAGAAGLGAGGRGGCGDRRTGRQ